MATRILLTDGLPRMLRDLLAGLAAEVEGLDVDERPYAPPELVRRVTGPAAGLEAYVVVYPFADLGLPHWATELLRERARLRFLALDPEGRHGALWELRLAGNRIEEISADALIAALREPEWGKSVGRLVS